MRFLLLFQLVLISNFAFSQTTFPIKIDKVEINKNNITNTCLLNDFITKLGKDYDGCGKDVSLKENYLFRIEILNKRLKTSVFNKNIQINRLCFYHKTNSFGETRLEEYIYVNSDFSKKAFAKYKEYTNPKFNTPTKDPRYKLVFIKNDRIFILDNYSLYNYPKEKNKLLKWITDFLLDGVPQEPIELYR